MKKNISRPQYYRVRHILEMIRAAGEDGKLPNARDFCRELRVSRATVIRDLDWLRDEENAPVEYVAERHGYRLSDMTWQVPPLRLSRKEVFAFAMADKLLTAFRGTPLEREMRSAFQKVSESLEGNVTIDSTAFGERLSLIPDDYVVQDPDIWSAVAGCVDRQERAEMVYEKFNGTVRDYILEPYHLFAYHGNWYVVGRHVRKERVATFAVSRIRLLKAAGEFFEVPADFDVNRHVAESFGIVRGEKAFKVRLLFSANVATYVRERIWHPSQRMVEKRNGGVELILETAGWKELVRWILSWQPDCRVLSPACLRKRVEEKMREALA